VEVDAMSAELWFAIVSLAIGVLGAGFSALASVIAYFVKKGEDVQDKAIESLRANYSTIQGDVDQIKQTLASYETHIGAGDARLAEIKNDIAEHVQKEEQIFWKKVDSISESQRIFAEAVLQRIASMEAKMPNGEIQEIIKALARLEANVLLTNAAAKAAQDHVAEHNDEAEDWKRRIVALETSMSSHRPQRKISGKK
jgi:chromosome segregation ATPase